MQLSQSNIWKKRYNNMLIHIIMNLMHINDYLVDERSAV